MTFPSRPPIARLGLVALIAALAGCTTSQNATVDDIGPVFAPRNISAPAGWPADVARVAVLPVSDATGTLPLNFVSTYDALVVQAAQRSQRAEFVAVDRESYSRWSGQVRVPASTALLPANWSARVREATAADAVLLVDVTHCSPYPPLALGLRAKLVRLDTGDVIWAADELFAASDPTVARAARRYAKAGLRSRGADAVSIFQSPSFFGAYAIDALAATLPRR